MDKRIDGLHKSLNQKIDTMQSSISSLINQPQVLEKGRFPSQTLPNPRGVHELRIGKEIEQPMLKFAGKTREQEEEEFEHIVINKDSMKESMPPISPRTERQQRRLLRKKASWKC